MCQVFIYCVVARDRLRQLILTQPHPTRVSSFAGKTKYFYESCMGLDTVDTVKSNDLVNQISSLGELLDEQFWF